MASSSAVSPRPLHDTKATTSDPSPTATGNQQPSSSQAATDSEHLSPQLSRVNSDTLSPSLLSFDTPADSASTLSHYQPSDFSDFEEDPFFGATFSNVDSLLPGFLDETALWNQSGSSLQHQADNASRDVNARHDVADEGLYPLTPERTASVHTASPRSELRAAGPQSSQQRLPDSISPQELQKPFKPSQVVTQPSHLSPSQSSSCRTSEDGAAQVSTAMNCRSPKVTVSVWDKDDNILGIADDDSFEQSPTTVRDTSTSAGDLITGGRSRDTVPATRNGSGNWHRDTAMGRSGLAPNNRPSDTVPSINDMANRRKVEERNGEVDEWLDDLGAPSRPTEPAADDIGSAELPTPEDDAAIPLGDTTENRYQPDQVYYDIKGGELNDTDFDMIAPNKWVDPPVLHPIRRGKSGQHQPQSSQAAIEKFEAMCRDTDSIISRKATWGTWRRRSLSTIDLDMEVTSGNLFKKLSISRSGSKGRKAGGLLKNIQGVFRRPSMTKRSRSGEHESSPTEDSSPVKRDSVSHLRPPSRTSSGKRKSISAMDTASALASMGQNAASIGGAHARTGSISAGTPTTPLKSPRGSLSVKTPWGRPRSKSEIPAQTQTLTPESAPQSALVGLLRKSGGRPAPFAKTTREIDDDEEEDDEDVQDDGEMKVDSNVIDEITPNFAGFQQHVLDLNPHLHGRFDYLVDRIAHQQVVRFKQLLNAKVEHFRIGPKCPCGPLCTTQGGSVISDKLNTEGKGRAAAAGPFDEDDDDTTPVDGTIQQDNFPADIPMPPAQRLPAEFECQLCYTRKKLQKPSDWTKHVHEDVQPFTCTWDRCKDPKAFKRKADWVRHENEGHRHLEWWTCDVEDCQHTCFRRDNFLQHLVREHRFPEPKVKTKTAVKKAGSVDPTWHKVDQCHIETPVKPHEEPCRFCGKEFPTWKKLTVHLAKHMEQISLPVLRLVAARARELDADTIISPVPDLPPRQFFPVSEQDNPSGLLHPGNAHSYNVPSNNPNSYRGTGGMDYTMMSHNAHFSQQYYGAPYGGFEGNLQQPQMGNNPMGATYAPQPNVRSMPGADGSGSYIQYPNTFFPMNQNDMGSSYGQMNAQGLQNAGVNQMDPRLTGQQLGGQMGYDGTMTPSASNTSAFSGQGNASPYSHSPRLNARNQNQAWDDRQLSGFQ